MSERDERPEEIAGMGEADDAWSLSDEMRQSILDDVRKQVREIAATVFDDGSTLYYEPEKWEE